MPDLRRRKKASSTSPPPRGDGGGSADASSSEDERAKFERDFEVRAAKAAFHKAVARRLGLWRLLFVGLMTYEWTKLRHEPYDLGGPGGRAGLDRVFCYQHLKWVPDTLPGTPGGVALNRGLGLGLGAAAAAGLGFDATGPAFAALFVRQFLGTTSAFNNHDYLFCLLLVLTALSGAGDALSVDAAIRGAPAPRGRERRRLCLLVALRAQLSVLYLFAAIWKCHADWFNGNIVRGIFLSFEQQGVSRGVPWASIEAAWPGVFPKLAAAGWALDVGMFASIAWRVPTPTAARFTFLLHLAFHGFTCFAMSPRIGYSFPLACLLAEVLYVPLPSDVRLPRWLAKLPRSPWRALAYAWVAFQLVFPLRMPLIAAYSGTSYARSGRAYRFSWTMMLHAKSSLLVLEPERHALTLGYIEPKCAVNRAPVPRHAYMPGTQMPLQDTRTLPLYAMLGPRMTAVLETYPRAAAALSARLAAIVETTSDPCKKRFGESRLTMTSTLFLDINDNAVFARVADPTVDLAVVGRAIAARGHWAAWGDALWDRAPPGHEWLLPNAGNRLVAAGDVDRLARRVRRDHGVPEHWEVAFLVDRAACLGSNPIWLKPPAPKLPMTVAVVALDYPGGAVVAARACADVDVHCDDPAMLEAGAATTVTKTHLELGLLSNVPAPRTTCANAPEDIVIAIAWDARRNVGAPPPGFDAAAFGGASPFGAGPAPPQDAPPGPGAPLNAPPGPDDFLWK